MAQLRPKIVKLAKVIGGVSGMVVKIDENAPEYYCMANIVSDDEADIAIAAGLRKEPAAYFAGEITKDEATELIKLSSRRYAKRQLTWLRRDETVKWYQWPSSPDFNEARRFSTEYLHSCGL